MESDPEANEYDKNIFRSISNFGGDAFRGGVMGGLGKLTNVWPSDVKKVYDVYDQVNTGKDLVSDMIDHKAHVSRGFNYQADCEICKSQWK